MKRTVGLWALSGLVVACGWFFMGLLTWPNYNLGRSPLVAITAPASLLGRTIPLAFYWFILLNAAFYGFIGFVTELVRRQISRQFAN